MVELAGSSIYYTFGDEATADMSAEFVLFLPPLAGQQPPVSKKRGTSIVIFDDMGRGTTDDVSGGMV